MKIIKKNIYIIKQFYSKLKKMNVISLFLFLLKIKSDMNLIFKFILIAVGSKTADFNSIWDLDDLFLKMVDQEPQETVKNEINDSGNNDKNDKTAQIIELVKAANEGQNVDFSSMDMDE